MIRNQEQARKALKEVNTESQELLARFGALTKKVEQIQYFLRHDAQNQPDGTAYSYRTAGSELSYVGRLLPKTLTILRRLANFELPLLVVDDEQDDEDSPNKIDKAAKVLKSKIDEAPESLSELDDE